MQTITMKYKKQKRKQNYKKTICKRALIRKQNESNKEINQTERKQKRENIRDDNIEMSRTFELATKNKKNVNGLNLH